MSELRFGADGRAFPVEDVDGDRDEDGDKSKNGGGPGEFIRTRDDFVDCSVCQYKERFWEGDRTRGRRDGRHLQGVAYMAAMPARKSRDMPLPPVAEAEYGP